MPVFHRWNRNAEHHTGRPRRRYETNLHKFAVFGLLLSLSCLGQVAQAQDQSSSGSPAPPPTQASGAAPQATSKEDKSGTNPLNFQKEFRLFNEVQILQGSGYQNFTTLQYIHPFASNFNVRLRLPFVGNDVTGSNKYGVGDLTLRANWVPFINRRVGVLLGTEFSFDTASSNALGTGKHTIAPVGVQVFFLKDGWLFAPAYQHTTSYAGDSARRNINLGATDFYLVKLTKSKRNWFILDPTIIADYKITAPRGPLSSRPVKSSAA